MSYFKAKMHQIRFQRPYVWPWWVGSLHHSDINTDVMAPTVIATAKTNTECDDSRSSTEYETYSGESLFSSFNAFML